MEAASTLVGVVVGGSGGAMVCSVFRWWYYRIGGHRSLGVYRMVDWMWLCTCYMYHQYTFFRRSRNTKDTTWIADAKGTNFNSCKILRQNNIAKRPNAFCFGLRRPPQINIRLLLYHPRHAHTTRPFGAIRTLRTGALRTIFRQMEEKV